MTYPERTKEREGKNNKIVADERQRRCPSSTMTAMMELHRYVGTVHATQLCHLGGAVVGRSLPRCLCHQVSSDVVGRGKALGLSAGIAIVALDRVRILLDKRFGICADP